jgi:hypothetical protein
MSNNKLSDAVRNASSVNLRYTASLVSLAREYVKALSDAITQGVSDTDEDEGKHSGAPLLLAGKVGETANAAFTVSGGANLPEMLTLSARGDFSDTKVWVEPSLLSLRDGSAPIVRIMGKIGRKTETGKDYPGEVVIEELNRKVTDFVLRRLPGD